ncbi:GntR family transcriptional regulator [Arthrobacter sp. MYb227]|uniref:GntR family transcriptional regulator n=1 Tax=Arthrobacter sp. MYb227 TaxID=1848601 RepID=UPI000CFCFA8D|nr:GntR family transcriptional regulator [Arthrobacter sp. MYb227]PQZ92896.1 GntR family transcriptional regulator [Arthrobacter sp. MYb227]
MNGVILDERTSTRPRVERESAAERVRSQIREQILTAELRPGEIVLENDLAALFGVSKTPVREALQMLMVEGLVSLLPRKGYMVRPLSFHDVRDVMELRLILEPPLLAAAARNVTDSLVLKLRSLLDQQFAPEKSLSDRVHAAREFHLACVGASRNERAATLVRMLTDEINRLHHLMPLVEDHIASDNEREAHEAILSAIAAGNAAEAESKMREHLIESNSAMVTAFYGSPLQ